MSRTEKEGRVFDDQGLDIPDYLKRDKDNVSPAMRMGEPKLGEAKDDKAKESGATTAMPLTGKAALAIRETDETILAKNANVIRALGKRAIGDVIEIGRRLAESKEIVGHGNWLSWLDREFGWGEITALNFMRVHAMVGKSSKFEDLNLPVSSLYLLAAPSTPEEVRDEVANRAAAGEKITVAHVQALKKAAGVTAAADRAVARSKAKPPKPDLAASLVDQIDDGSFQKIADRAEARANALAIVDEIAETRPETYPADEIGRFAEFCKQNYPATVASGVLEHEVVDLMSQVATIDAWLGTFVVMLEQHKRAMSAPVN